MLFSERFTWKWAAGSRFITSNFKFVLLMSSFLLALWISRLLLAFHRPLQYESTIFSVKFSLLQHKLAAETWPGWAGKPQRKEVKVTKAKKEARWKLTPQKAAIVDDGFLPNGNGLPSRPAGLHVLLITLHHLVPQNYMLPNGLLMVIGFCAL